MASLLQELRLAVRSMFREKVFTAVVVTTLALSIGATTSVFSVVYQVLWRPLPYPEASQLYRLFQTTTPGAGAGPLRDRVRVTRPVWNAWREASRSFSRIEGFQGGRQVLSGAEVDDRLTVGRASAGLLPMLGVQPLLGRLWGAELEVPGRDSEAVLSHSLWQRLYGADPGVLGQSIVLDDRVHTIVGILPASFQFEPEVEVWKPLALDPATEQSSALRVFGLLRPGLTPEQGRSELVQLALGTERVPGVVLTGASVEPLHQLWVEQSQTQLQVVSVVAALLLLLGCANLANLLLARGSARMHEMSVRLALGASRARLVRLVFVESAVRALLGGVLGLLIALWGRDLLGTLVPPQLVSGPGVEPFVLVTASLVSLTTAVLVGLLPALHVSRGTGTLTTMARGTRATSLGLTRSVLVVVQLSLAMVPLVGAGLMLRTVWKLQDVPLGFEPRGVTVAEVFLPLEKYASEDASASVVRELIASIESIPGVSAVGLTGNLPFSGSVWRQTTRFQLVGESSGEASPQVGYVPVTGGYFQALGVPLKEGRYPDARDTASSPRVIVVTEAFARRFLPGRSAVGARLELDVVDGGSREAREIVGVVGDVPMERLSVMPSGDIYVPLTQDLRHTLSLAVRSTLPAGQLMPLLHQRLRATDASLRMLKVRPLETVVEESYAQVRVVGGLLGAFAALAVVLAAVGLYGILAFWVAQRTRELGIRSALGATPRRLLRMVIGQGLRLTGLGLLAGLVGALLVARALAAMLFGVSTYDPLIFLGAPAVLLLTALAASWLPAVSAMRVAPNEALKRDG
ncbi:ABC transporter permease [Pyxidicoccus parkwayensis]|uniref:ABC transporter permease n=1 Tax=Pyxidicoccus parkwayensis TaxID=2813578 RepID=A0ABX7NUH7_9BACT|nr:ADOP family duplicated permease [Pyxidicoccus parkwaysis]QSQ22529.1 ABC transporter permease [Pyxidicoccus parkwaysis]